MSILGARAPVFRGGAALGNDPSYINNFVSRFGYDPVKAVLDRLNAIGLEGGSQKDVERAVGGLFNLGYIGRSELRRVPLDSIENPLTRQRFRGILEMLNNPNSGYYHGNLDFFNSKENADPIGAQNKETENERDRMERERMNEILLGDERFDQNFRERVQQIGAGTASLDTYINVHRLGNDPEANAIKRLWLELMFSWGFDGDIRDVILNIGLADPPEWIKRITDWALDAIRRLFTADAANLQSFLSGKTSIGEARGNVFNIDTQALSNLTQSLAQLLAGKPEAAKRYVMKEVLRQLETKLDGNSGLKEFFNRNNASPIKAVQLALPFVIAANMSTKQVDLIIEGIMDSMGLGFLPAPTLEGAEQDIDQDIVQGFSSETDVGREVGRVD